jgi:Zn-finger nucleic acid-binding protein
MSAVQTCPKCAGNLRTRQVNNLLSKYCDRCGSLPFATDVKTGESVFVDRSGEPASRRPSPEQAS